MRVGNSARGHSLARLFPALVFVTAGGAARIGFQTGEFLRDLSDLAKCSSFLFRGLGRVLQRRGVFNGVSTWAAAEDCPPRGARKTKATRKG